MKKNRGIRILLCTFSSFSLVTHAAERIKLIPELRYAKEKEEKKRERTIEKRLKKMHIPEQVGKELEPEVKDLSFFQRNMYRLGVPTAETKPILEELADETKKRKNEARQKIEAELIQQEKRERQEAQARIARNIGSTIRKTGNYLTDSETLQKLGLKIGSTLRRGSEAISPLLSTPKQLHTKQEIENLADELYQKKMTSGWYKFLSPTQEQRNILHNEALKEARIQIQAMPSKKADYTLGSSFRKAWNAVKKSLSPVDERTKAAIMMDAQKQKHLEQKRLEAAETAIERIALKQKQIDVKSPAGALSPEEAKSILVDIGVMAELSPKRSLKKALSQPMEWVALKHWDVLSTEEKKREKAADAADEEWALRQRALRSPKGYFSPEEEKVERQKIKRIIRDSPRKLLSKYYPNEYPANPSKDLLAEPPISPKKSFWQGIRQRFSSPPAEPSKESSIPYQDVRFLRH